jgi:hypothetical protein
MLAKAAMDRDPMQGEMGLIEPNRDSVQKRDRPKMVAE